MDDNFPSNPTIKCHFFFIGILKILAVQNTCITTHPKIVLAEHGEV
jgi:hypothetical protein